MDNSQDAVTGQPSAAGHAKRRQPGAFPPVGSEFAVRRRAYVLSDPDGRTWLAIDPAVSSGGVMQPLRPGETATMVSVEDDGVVLRVSSPQGIDSDLDAFLVPKRLVPPSLGG